MEFEFEASRMPRSLPLVFPMITSVAAADVR
jgi:hypothetical protein